MKKMITKRNICMYVATATKKNENCDLLPYQISLNTQVAPTWTESLGPPERIRPPLSSVATADPCNAFPDAPVPTSFGPICENGVGEEVLTRKAQRAPIPELS